MGRAIVYFAPQRALATSPYGMTLSNTTLSVLVIISLVLALAALGLLLSPGAARRRRARTRSGVSPDRALEALSRTHDRSIKRLEGAVRQLALSDKKLTGLVEEAVRH